MPACGRTIRRRWQAESRYRVGISRSQANARVRGRIPGLGWALPPGLIATTARTRGSTSAVARTVHPPKLCPTNPIRPPLLSRSPGSAIFPPCTLIPLANAYELFARTPASKRLFILRRADHQHFLDDVEGEHEAIRAMSLPGEAAWIPAAMQPIAELCSGEQAHLFVRGLTLAHLDGTLRQLGAARRFLAGD